MTESRSTTSSAAGHLSRRLIRGGIWVVVSRIGGIGLFLVSNLILARMLSPDEFGLFILTTSIITFASIPARLGVDRAVVRFLSECFAQRDADRARKTLKACAVLAFFSSIAACVVCGLFVLLFGHALGLPTGWVMVCITVLAVAVITVLHVTAESFRGIHDLRFSSLFNAVNGPLISIVFLVLIVIVASTTKLSLELALVAYVASFAIVIPFALVCFQQMFSKYITQRTVLDVEASNHTDLSTARQLSLPQLLAICIPNMLIQLAVFGSTRGDILIAGATCSQDELALYGAACRLILMVGIPMNMVNLTVLSTIPEVYAQRRTAELQRLLQKSATFAAIPSVVLLTTIMLFPGLIMSIVFGPFYEGAATLLIVLSLGRIANCLTGSCQMALVMTGHHNFELLTNVVSFAGLLILGPLAAYRFGMLGLAVASTSIFVLMNIASWLLARRLVGVWTNPSLSPTLWSPKSRQLQTFDTVGVAEKS